MGDSMTVCCEVDLVLSQRRLRLRHRRLLRSQLRFRGAHGHFRGFELGLRDQLLLRQLPRASQLRSRVIERHAQPLEIGLGANQVCARLLDLRLKEGRIEARQHLALAHERIEVGVELLDGARHLRADLNGRDGLELTGGADRFGDVAARDARGVTVGATGFCV